MGGKSFSNKGTAKLTLDAYVAARTAMMSMTNSKGEPLGLVPDKLVVPPALEKAARDILVSDFINGTRNTMQGTAKPWSSPPGGQGFRLVPAVHHPAHQAPHLPATQESQVRLPDQ